MISIYKTGIYTTMFFLKFDNQFTVQFGICFVLYVKWDVHTGDMRGIGVDSVNGLTFSH